MGRVARRCRTTRTPGSIVLARESFRTAIVGTRWSKKSRWRELIHEQGRAPDRRSAHVCAANVRGGVERRPVHGSAPAPRLQAQRPSGCACPGTAQRSLHPSVDDDPSPQPPTMPLRVEHITAGQGSEDRLLLRVSDGQRPEDARRPISTSTPRSVPSRSTRRPTTRSYCRVFAPMYRQLTLAGIGAAPSSPPRSAPATRPPAPANPAAAYADVLGAWKTYLNELQPRPRVSSSSATPRGRSSSSNCSAGRSTTSPSVRKLLVSAIILGGNVTVKKGERRRRDLQAHPGLPFGHAARLRGGVLHLRRPRPRRQLVRADTHGRGCRCCAPIRPPWPAGSAPLDAVIPSAPFAPGTIIGQATGLCSG